jgi:predicted transposase/invertase (TIGR01784 family)
MPIKSSNNHLNPHDRFFRAMMHEPKVIREFFEQNLPSNIKAVIDFSTIQLQQESFIDDKLKLQIADLLYSAEFSSQEGYLYLLLEHQSTPDKLMAFRILRYMVAIMEYHLKKTKRDELPIIYPVIFYTGNRSYNYSTDLFDLFGARKELAKDILWQPYQLIDLSKTPDEKLKEFLRYGIIAKTMKYIHQKDFIPMLREIVKDLRTIENFVDMHYIYTILSYIIEAGELDKQEFITTVKAGLTQVSEVNIMTLAEQFRQEGYEKAKTTLAAQFIREGELKGKLEGKLEALRAVAIKLLSQDMSSAQISTITGLSVAEIEQLKTSGSFD